VYISAHDLPQISINEIFINKLLGGGLLFRRGIVVQLQKGTFFIPRFRKYSLKISVDNYFLKSGNKYYLLALTENFSKSYALFF